VRIFKKYETAIDDFERVLLRVPPELRNKINRAVTPASDCAYEQWRARRDAADILGRCSLRTCLLSALGVI